VSRPLQPLAMRFLLAALLTYAIRGEDLLPLRWMAQTAAWGAANDQTHGRTFGEWDAHSARHATHLDALNEALEESPAVKHLELMSEKAAWGATNERAYGKDRSGSQVDWDMAKSAAEKLESLVGKDFAEKLHLAAKSAAWYAANRYQYGEGHKDTQNDLKALHQHITDAKSLAPSKWPMEDVEAIFKYDALKAASHRHVQLAELKKKKKADFHHDDYAPEPNREDWQAFHKHAVEFKKELGKDQHSLFVHFEGMCLEASWGAVSERAQGKHSADAKTHWKKEEFHSQEAQRLYKGSKDFQDIRQMIRMASWGAANERTYGADSAETKRSWVDFNSYVAKVLSKHDEM